MWTPARVDAQPLITPAKRQQYRSNAYIHALARIARFARNYAVPLLIEGESGTGKTVLAREIHMLSPRAHRAFHSVALSSVDDSLVNSELFGHVAGAFTDARANRAGVFVSANGGTLFLDEIGKASPVVQHRLLHAVEAREVRPIGSDRDVPVDVRVVAATNVGLEQLVAEGRFLPDLYARLETFRVRIPSLRERRADIPVLVQEALDRHAPACGYKVAPSIDTDLMAALQHADWPNNLRQLDATVNRILIDAEGSPELSLTHCVDDLAYLRIGPAPHDRLDEQEVAEAMRKGKNMSETAALLGVHRTTLYRFQKRLGRGPGDG